MELIGGKQAALRAVPLRVETSAAYKEIIEQHGQLITPYFAARLARVSRQRIYQLLEQGRFTIVVAWGVVQLPLAEFERWENSERKPGRVPKRRRRHRKEPVRVTKNVAQLEFWTERPGEERSTESN